MESWSVGWVYFVRCEPLGVIKIGWSTNPRQRLREIASPFPYPVHLVACMPGSMEREQRLHRWFAPIRMNGEWFQATVKLDRLIALVLQKYGQFGDLRPLPPVAAATVARDEDRDFLLQSTETDFRRDVAWLSWRDRRRLGMPSEGQLQALSNEGLILQSTADSLMSRDYMRGRTPYRRDAR